MAGDSKEILVGDSTFGGSQEIHLISHHNMSYHTVWHTYTGWKRGCATLSHSIEAHTVLLKYLQTEEPIDACVALSQRGQSR